MHKWIGTYNTYRNQLIRFFKWLYSPNIEPYNRPKPEVMENIPQLRRKEKSVYKPSDLWTPEEDPFFAWLIFTFTAVIIAFVWGPETLAKAKYRYSKFV